MLIRLNNTFIKFVASYDVQQPAVLVLDREAFVRGFEGVVKQLSDSSKDVKERKNFDSIAKTLSDWGFHLTDGKVSSTKMKNSKGQYFVNLFKGPDRVSVFGKAEDHWSRIQCGEATLKDPPEFLSYIIQVPKKSDLKIQKLTKLFGDEKSARDFVNSHGEQLVCDGEHGSWHTFDFDICPELFKVDVALDSLFPSAGPEDLHNLFQFIRPHPKPEITPKDTERLSLKEVASAVKMFGPWKSIINNLREFVLSGWGHSFFGWLSREEQVQLANSSANVLPVVFLCGSNSYNWVMILKRLYEEPERHPIARDQGHWILLGPTRKEDKEAPSLVSLLNETLAPFSSGGLGVGVECPTSNIQLLTPSPPQDVQDVVGERNKAAGGYSFTKVSPGPSSVYSSVIGSPVSVQTPGSETHGFIDIKEEASSSGEYDDESDRRRKKRSAPAPYRQAQSQSQSQDSPSSMSEPNAMQLAPLDGSGSYTAAPMSPADYNFLPYDGTQPYPGTADFPMQNANGTTEQTPWSEGTNFF